MGASLLVRTPLFLFPPVVVFCDWLCSSDRLRVFLLRSLVFLAASYVLLVPWAALNHSVSGKSAFFDDARARDNVVTAAMGSIFVMEGNSLKAAGLAEGDSAFSFYVREVGKKPFFHAVTVLRRLWHIFLFYPVLFTLFLAAVFFSREKGKTLVFCLPVYFILIHSPLSIEVRYFYPLLYLLPPLIAGTFLPERFSMSPELRVFTGRAIKAAAWASFTAVLVCEVFITAYPARAAHNPLAEDSFTRASERFPRDRVFYEMKCRELWRAGDDAAFYTCLEGQSQKFGDKVKAYFLSVKSSAVPSLVQLPPGGENQDFILGCLIVRMLREFELGEKKAAMASFREAHGVFERNYNRLHGNQKSGVKKLDDREDAEPYRNDRDIAGRISRDSDRFWEMAYGIIIMWPPEGMVKILSGIKENIGLEGRMEMLDGLLAGTGGEAGEGSRGARERIASASAGMRGTLPRLSPGGPGLPGYRSETGKRSESMRRE